ncbi:Zinc finger matrin-type protein 2 [Vanrija pseudolonga]|uniref:Zinc finger matrin-type protein 2 n=1 Tax=Vanrija pseudolonga TaxID=143232 RepID=A0AAF0Y6Z5_9TREE|nr:Zinc finger matrin-type protein 2 [Vanrija pseudolonga]
MEGKPPPPERKQWDKGEWAEKARARDVAAADHAKKAEEAAKEGRKYRPMPDGPAPTGLAQQHKDLNLSKNLGKTVLVQTSTGTQGPRGAGFYCELCNRTLKDSLSYLDHLNSRFHLAKLGQSTHVARSTVAQVRERICQLREESKTKVDAKNFDFQKRLAVVREAEQAKKDARREDRKRKREERREEAKLGRVGVQKGASGAEVAAAVGEQNSIEAMMGFGGFGGARKR